MKILFVNEPGVYELLTMQACIPLMRDTLILLANGDVVLSLRGKVGDSSLERPLHGSSNCAD